MQVYIEVYLQGEVIVEHDIAADFALVPLGFRSLGVIPLLKEGAGEGTRVTALC